MRKIVFLAILVAVARHAASGTNPQARLREVVPLPAIITYARRLTLCQCGLNLGHRLDTLNAASNPNCLWAGKTTRYMNSDIVSSSPSPHSNPSFSPPMALKCSCARNWAAPLSILYSSGSRYRINRSSANSGSSSGSSLRSRAAFGALFRLDFLPIPA